MSDRTAFTVTSNNPVPVGEATGFPPGTEMAATLRLSGAGPQTPPLARICVPRTNAPLSLSAPVPFWVQGSSGELLCSVRPADSDAFDVHGADGAPLTRITYRHGRFVPWPRRTRWSAAGFTGRAGTWYAWLGYVVTYPVWLIAAVFSVVYALIEGDTTDSAWRPPTRVRWRGRGLRTVLDYRGLSKAYRVDPRHIDIRIAYSLAVLHNWSRT
ncbi:hypothetical protein [Streptomyces sp. NPDC016845]|uniref:hypothetical protein n=1 Tax=Streptomyces sp. NPDC016845 TaxID=3364972 RepID=UPI0037BB8509